MNSPERYFMEVATPYARKFMGIDTNALGQLLRQLVEAMYSLLSMPAILERILVKLEAGQFVINLGGDIGIGATAFHRRERNGAEAAFPLSLALIFIGCLGLAAFFLYDHNQLLAMVLAAFLGLRLFFRW